MKVGTDAVLLGAWCDLEGAQRVLDVGTGCGVIALMAAQRTTAGCRIDAIDIDADSVDEASDNFGRSPWAHRLSARLVDFNDMDVAAAYDVIVTNPPFFAEAVLPPDAIRSAARHTHSLAFDQLIQGAARLLTPQGSIALITPCEARDKVIEAATFARLHLRRVTTVYPREEKAPKRVLWQWGKERVDTQHGILVMHDGNGDDTPQYRALCQDFYLDRES